MERMLSFRPPRIALACLAAAAGLHALSPAGTVLFISHRLLGMLSIGAGLVVMTWAWAIFTARKTAICPTAKATALVRSGPFRFTRNPMYLGFVLMLCGAAFLLNSVIAFLAPFAFFMTMHEVFIPFEERNLERIFGEEYRKYRMRVRRWL